MTEKQRINLIKKLAKKGKKKRTPKKIDSDFVALEPIAPNDNDINEEYAHLTRYTADQHINYEEE